MQVSPRWIPQYASLCSTILVPNFAGIICECREQTAEFIDRFCVAPILQLGSLVHTCSLAYQHSHWVFKEKDDFICNGVLTCLYNLSGKIIRGIWKKTSVDCYLVAFPCRLCWMRCIPINASNDSCTSSCWFWWKWPGAPSKHPNP